MSRPASASVLVEGGFATAPLAAVELPRRVPFGFDGNWKPAG